MWFPAAALSNPVRLGLGRACARNQLADVTVEPFTGVRCAECGRPWLRLYGERRRGYRTDIEEEQPEVVF